MKQTWKDMSERLFTQIKKEEDKIGTKNKPSIQNILRIVDIGSQAKKIPLFIELRDEVFWHDAVNPASALEFVDKWKWEEVA